MQINYLRYIQIIFISKIMNMMETRLSLQRSGVYFEVFFLFPSGDFYFEEQCEPASVSIVTLAVLPASC